MATHANAVGLLIAAIVAAVVVYGGVAISQFTFLVLDDQAGGLDALVSSAGMTKGHRCEVLG